MGAAAAVFERQPLRESVVSGAEEDYSSNAYHNILRLTIIENIRLEFQRPTTVLLYGCPYGCLEIVTQFLAKKMEFDVLKCEIDQPLGSDLKEVFETSQKFGILFQNYPQTFDQMLSLQSLTNSSQIVVIFLNCSYAVRILS